VELGQCERRVLGTRLGKRAGEERVTAVESNPPREFAVEAVQGDGGGARSGVTPRSFGPVTVDQAVRDLSRRRLLS
jgi:hypothetical protein